MMAFALGWGWFAIFLIVGLVCVVGILYALADGRRILAVMAFIGTLAFGYLGLYSITHYLVDPLTKHVVIDETTGDVLKVVESGLQDRPICCVHTEYFRVNAQERISIDLQPGTAAATSKDHIPLWVDATLFLDLTGLNAQLAYQSVNGNWDRFYENYLQPQIAGLVRTTTSQFTVQEHESRRADWEHAFEDNVRAFFESSDGAGSRLGIRVVPGLAVMSFDFTNPEHATAYDRSNTTQFLVAQRQNERNAAEIEREINEIRAGNLSLQAQGVIDSWTQVMTFASGLPESDRMFLVQFMQLQSQLEYLRLVDQSDTEIILPPGNSGATIMVVPQTQQTAVPPQ